MDKNKKYIYIVIHNQGIDGSYTVTTFSNYKDAQTLCEMYNKTSASGEYDFYYVSKEQINKYDMNNFSLKTKDNWTDLYYNRRKFNG